MKGSWNFGLAALAMVAMCTAGGFAQCIPGQAGVPGDGCPDLIFDSATGIMTFNADGAQVQSLLIEGPDPTTAGLLDPDGNWPVASELIGVNWTVLNLGVNPPRILTGTYSYFADRYQNIMFTDTGNTGWNNTTDLAVIQYPLGTRLDDFASMNPDGNVEMSTWDDDPMNPPPSTTIFTQVVPEPAGLVLLGIALLGFSGLRRR